MEPTSPSVWCSARRNTPRSVRAVALARSEWEGCPPRVVRGAATQAATASGVNHTVRLPRARRAASYAAQLVTRCCLLGDVMATGCFGFERHGRDPSIRKGAVVLHRLAPDANRPIRATRWRGCADQDDVGAGKGLQAGGEVRRIADNGLLARGAFADCLANHNEPASDADACGEARP